MIGMKRCSQDWMYFFFFDFFCKLKLKQDEESSQTSGVDDNTSELFSEDSGDPSLTDLAMGDFSFFFLVPLNSFSVGTVGQIGERCDIPQNPNKHHLKAIKICPKR